MDSLCHPCVTTTKPLPGTCGAWTLRGNGAAKGRDFETTWSTTEKGWLMLNEFETNPADPSQPLLSKCLSCSPKSILGPRKCHRKSSLFKLSAERPAKKKSSAARSYLLLDCLEKEMNGFHQEPLRSLVASWETCWDQKHWTVHRSRKSKTHTYPWEAFVWVNCTTPQPAWQWVRWKTT